MSAPRHSPVPGTLGALERQAGLSPDPDSRFTFWIAFKDHPDPIAAGVAVLRGRIVENAAAPETSTATPKK
ncbi:MAG: hypothetical protein AB8B85_23100 [Paracoccaceae bacterium]